MDQKSESTWMHGRLAWIISAWYLFVLWSWSAPLYGGNGELFAVSLVIMLSGIVLAVISFSGFLYGLRKSAQRQSLPDNDFIIRVLIDLGALTVLSRFSVTMNRVSEALDADAALLLVAGVIVLTLVYGAVRAVIGISSVRGYFAARWRAVAAILLGLMIAGTWHDLVRALRFLLAGMGIGVQGPADAVARGLTLGVLWYGGYVFSLALLATFLVMLAASFRQFGMIRSDIAGLAARAQAGLKRQPLKKLKKEPGRAANTGIAAAGRPARAAPRRR
jgi:hypothetical protein